MKCFKPPNARADSPKGNSPRLTSRLFRPAEFCFNASFAVRYGVRTSSGVANCHAVTGSVLATATCRARCWSFNSAHKFLCGLKTKFNHHVPGAMYCARHVILCLNHRREMLRFFQNNLAWTRYFGYRNRIVSRHDEVVCHRECAIVRNCPV